jgi:hypothetical protein
MSDSAIVPAVISPVTILLDRLSLEYAIAAFDFTSAFTIFVIVLLSESIDLLVKVSVDDVVIPPSTWLEAVPLW